MLLKEQKAKFSFLASDEEDEDDRREEKQKVKRGEGAVRRGGLGDVKGEEPGGDEAETEHRRKGEREGHRERKRGRGGDARKSPPEPSVPTPSSTHAPPPEEPSLQVSPPGTAALQEESAEAGSADTLGRTGAHTPPYNGQSQVRVHDSIQVPGFCCKLSESTLTCTEQPAIFFYYFFYL